MTIHVRVSLCASSLLSRGLSDQQDDTGEWRCWDHFPTSHFRPASWKDPWGIFISRVCMNNSSPWKFVYSTWKRLRCKQPGGMKYSRWQAEFRYMLQRVTMQALFDSTFLKAWDIPRVGSHGWNAARGRGRKRVREGGEKGTSYGVPTSPWRLSSRTHSCLATRQSTTALTRARGVPRATRNFPCPACNAASPLPF